jgi:hypothetical protein
LPPAFASLFAAERPFILAKKRGSPFEV